MSLWIKLKGTHKSSAVFTESGLQVCHLLEVMDETWSHLTLEQWVSPQEIRYHLILTDQSISERQERDSNAD